MLFTAQLFNKNRYRKVSDNFQHFSNPAAGVIQMLSSTASHWILAAQMKTKLHRLSAPCQHQQQNNKYINSEKGINVINTTPFNQPLYHPLWLLKKVFKYKFFKL